MKPLKGLPRRSHEKRIWNCHRGDDSLFTRNSQLKASRSNDETGTPDPSQRRAGILVLLTVPMAWGTFEPAVRYVYDIQPDVPPFVFQFVYYAIATSALAALSSTHLLSNASRNVETHDVGTSAMARLLSIQGGLELGTYLFLGNGMQVIGLKTIPSDRAAFLLQLTTIFVPLVQSLAARNLSILGIRTWIACFMALMGVAFIGLDGSSSDDVANQSLKFSQGDLYIVLAALFYTFHCIRLEAYAKTTPALQLALSKASVETVWCGLVITIALLLATSGNDTPLPLLDLSRAVGENIMEYREDFINSIQDTNISSEQWAKLALATIWIALVTIGYTLTAQSYGQARVPPATANLIYTIQPLFTALIAYLVLGETLGLAGYVGGFLIGAAVVLVIRDETSREYGSNGEESSDRPTNSTQ
jgi:drug/metabolite transporter (DMT)-like permease